MSFVEIRAYLVELEQERTAAELAGLADQAYLADLESEVRECRAALVGALVTEVATFRGELYGRNVG